MTRPAAERVLARDLRADGWTLRQIAEHTGVALATASEWVRDVDASRAEPEPRRSYRSLVIWTSGETKRCGRCGLLLPLELFNRSTKGRQGWCRSCFLGYHAANGGGAIARRHERRERARGFVAAYLSTHPCADCGETDTLVMEFDHVVTKRDWISRLVARGAPLTRIEEEMERCEVVCVNCHRRRSAHRSGSRRLGLEDTSAGTRPLRERNFAFLFDALRCGCVDCGETDIVVLDFDHRDAKHASVTQLARDECSLPRLQREIDRCDIRCANCHRRRTAAARGGVSASG